MVSDKIKIQGGFRSVLLLLSTVGLLAGSVVVWFFVNRSVQVQRKNEFSSVIEVTEERVRDRVNSVIERLYDLRGFVSSAEINNNIWKNYIISVGVEDRFPSVYTIAYAPFVKRGNLDSYINMVRNEEKGAEYKQYSVFPESTNAELFPIRLLYTKDRDLGSLLGYDIGTSETQAAAVKMAVSEDMPVVTDLLYLRKVIPDNPKTGYVVMLPVYNKIDIGQYPKEERKQYFIGLVGTWVFPSGMVYDDHIKNILETNGVSMTVYDGDINIFSTGEGKGELKEVKHVDIFGKVFRFEYVGKAQFIIGRFSNSLPELAFLSILLINLLWWATVISILRSRSDAVKMAEEATKDLRKFKQAVEGVSDLVVITDQDGVIIYVNKASEKITGYRRESVLGKKVSVWGNQMSKDFYRRFWKIIKEDKKPFWGEVTNRRKSGELYPAEINVSPILDERGELLFFVGIERDLSDIKAVEQMKTEFISLASHQLRTPLSAVKWFGSMLLSGDAGKLNTTQSDYVEKINESNEREIRLVNSLLNVSRIESGKIVVVPKQTDLQKLVSTVVTDFKVEIEKSNRKLTVVLDKNIPMISIDEDLIRHVYANFVSNAIRYTKKEGKIILKVFRSKNFVISEVKDNGIGIPKVEQKRVFEKFFRASNALKKETDGNGLGLYLSRTIVESSGGKIGFRSSEGKGSTFWFSLPIKTREK